MDVFGCTHTAIGLGGITGAGADKAKFHVRLRADDSVAPGPHPQQRITMHLSLQCGHNGRVRRHGRGVALFIFLP